MMGRNAGGDSQPDMAALEKVGVAWWGRPMVVEVAP